MKTCIHPVTDSRRHPLSHTSSIFSVFLQGLLWRSLERLWLCHCHWKCCGCDFNRNPCEYKELPSHVFFFLKDNCTNKDIHVLFQHKECIHLYKINHYMDYIVCIYGTSIDQKSIYCPPICPSFDFLLLIRDQVMAAMRHHDGVPGLLSSTSWGTPRCSKARRDM